MIKHLIPLSAASLALLLSGCGSSGSSSNNSPSTASLSIGFSDAPVDDVKKVVIELDQIVLRRDGHDDLIIDRFTSTDLGFTDADSFQIDLMEYRGQNQAIVIDSLEVPADDYTHMILTIIEEDINSSYVQELDDTLKIIKVPSEMLKLGGFSVDPSGVQTFTVEFDLRRAMTYNPGPDRYILKPHGVSIVDNATAATLGGSIDPSLFNSAPCDGKAEPNIGNALYLYTGHSLSTDSLVDAFDPDLANNGAQTGDIAPYRIESVIEDTQSTDWLYSFSFLPPGDYTLAFSCNAGTDLPDTVDGTLIPAPTDHLIELSLAAGEAASCSLSSSNAGSCSN